MRLLQVTYYSLDRPRHGGQIRCDKIRESLLEAGVQVENLSVLGPGQSTAIGWQISVEPGYESRWLPREAEGPLADFALGKELQRGEFIEKIGEFLNSRHYDAVLIEQPWLFRAIWNFLRSRGEKMPKFIYSSHNVESHLKDQMLKLVGNVSEASRERLVRQVREEEVFAIRNASLVVAVTDKDLAYCQENGARLTVLAGNGSRPRPMRGNMKVRNFGLFVGSAHAPNLAGFLDIFRGDFLFLPPSWSIVCVGGVSNLIQNSIEAGHIDRSSTSRLRLLGEVEEDTLDQLIDSASFVLLPITQGGGSNLKTAEALAFGKAIFGTTTAFRGFEQWAMSPGVVCADDSVEMKSAIYDFVVRASDSQGSFSRQSTVELPLHWSDTLSGFVKLVRSGAF
jgi:glycosyltransferase involved in cell wall biosynthesis